MENKLKLTSIALFMSEFCITKTKEAMTRWSDRFVSVANSLLTDQLMTHL